MARHALRVLAKTEVAAVTPDGLACMALHHKAVDLRRFTRGIR
jgi:hypothetical protein